MPSLDNTHSARLNGEEEAAVFELYSGTGDYRLVSTAHSPSRWLLSPPVRAAGLASPRRPLLSLPAAVLYPLQHADLLYDHTKKKRARRLFRCYCANSYMYDKFDN